jgi:hypothetical protein
VESVFLIYTQGVFAFYDLPEHLTYKFKNHVPLNKNRGGN